MMDDDIDDIHNLNTHDKYVDAMIHVEDRQKSPCYKCNRRCSVHEQIYCDRYKDWRKMMLHYGQ